MQLSLAGTLRITPEATALSYLPSRARARVCVYGGLLELTMGLQITHIYQPLQAPSTAKKSKQYCFILMFGVLRAIRKTRIRQGIVLVPSKAVCCTLFKILRRLSARCKMLFRGTAGRGGKICVSCTNILSLDFSTFQAYNLETEM